MEPKIFGYQHLIYDGIAIILMIASIYLIRKFIKKEKYITLFIKCTGFLLLVCILWNRIGIARNNQDVRYLIPNSYCGMSSLVLSLAILLGKKDNIVLHFVMYLAIVGGTLTMIYPDFIGQNQSFFFSMTISGLLHHTLMVYLFYLTIVTGYFQPTFKKWYALVIGGAAYLAIGYFLIYVVGLPDAMEIVRPLLSGTIFYWYTLYPLFAIVYFGIVGLYKWIQNQQLKKATL